MKQIDEHLLKNDQTFSLAEEWIGYMDINRDENTHPYN